MYAQDIANARLQSTGDTVTVSGIVTNGDELGAVRHFEDGTAGIAAYDLTNLTGILRGDSITVTGILYDYNGLLELQPVISFVNHGNGYTINPQLVTPSQISETTESELVKIENTSIDNGGTNFVQGVHNFNAKWRKRHTFSKIWSSINWTNDSNGTNNAYRNKFSIYIYKWRISTFTKRC